jgi:hypothetical protein
MPNATLTQSASAPLANSFCVLVASADETLDIFDVVFQNAETIWRDCDWPRYAGFTTQQPDRFGFHVISANKADWRERVCGQLDCLPQNIRYVLLPIEDFFLTAPVNGAELNAVAEQVRRGNLAHVRLVPISRSILGYGLEWLRRTFTKEPLRPLAFSEPYYSSVEPAIWRRDYLRALLQQPGTIWQFEYTIGPERHYAVWRPVVRYRALVGRAKWYRFAPALLARHGLSLANSRRGRQTLRFTLRTMRQTLTFRIFGYLTYRIRRRLNKLPAR